MPSGTWVFRSVWPSDRGCQRGARAEAAAVTSVQRKRILVISLACAVGVLDQYAVLWTVVLHARESSFALLQWCLCQYECFDSGFAHNHNGAAVLLYNGVLAAVLLYNGVLRKRFVGLAQ